MTTEEVKTSFVADVAKYKKDIQDAQKVLSQFIKSADTSLSKQQAAEYRLQTATQKTMRAQAEATKAQYNSLAKTTSATRSATGATQQYTKSHQDLGQALYYTARRIAMVVTAARTFGNIINTGLGFNQLKEDAETTFTVMFKSAEKAQQQIENLYAFAVKSPLGFKETITASKQLAAYGFTAEEMIPTMELLGTVAKATGHSLDDIAYVYGTLKTQGRAYSRDLMQFGMRGIPIYDELAKVLGVNKTEIQKMAAAGKIGFKEVEQAFKNMVASGGRLFGLLERYMDTLTGKLSELADVWEMSLGKVFVGVFNTLKTLMPQITTILQSGEMQNTIATISYDIGNLAKAIGNLTVFLIKAAPTLYQFFKMWLAIKGLGLAKKIFGGLPDLLKKIFMQVRAITPALVAFGSGAPIAGLSTLATRFGIVTAAVKALGAAILANPVLLAFAGITAGVGVIGSQVLEVAKHRKRMATDPEYADTHNRETISGVLREMGSVYDLSTFAAKGSTAEQMKMIQTVVVRTNTDLKVASQILYDMGIISASVARNWNDIYGNTAKTVREMSDANYQRWLSGEWAGQIYGENYEMREYGDIFKALGLTLEDWKGMAEPSVAAYINLFKKTLTSDAILEGLRASGADAETIAEEQARIYGERYNQTLEAYTNLVTLLPNPKDKEKLKAALAALLGEYQTYAKGTGKAVKSSLEDISGYLDDLRVKSTFTELDNITLNFERSLQQAFGYLEKGLLTLEEWEQAVDYITTAFQHEKNAITYKIALEGDDTFFQELQDRIAEALESGDIAGAASGQLAMATKGTDFGDLLAGGDIIMMMIKGFTDMLLSIENVNKSFNFIATIFNAAKNILGPIIDTVFLPVVNILEMFGEVVGAVLAPVMNLIGIIFAGFYPVVSYFMAVVQMFGAAFAWINNQVIVPVGNAIIDGINLFLTALNNTFGWLGVNIRLLARLKTTTEALIESMNADLLINSMEYAVDKLNGLLDEEIATWKELYEVGAVTGAQYTAEVQALNEMRIDLDEQMLMVEVTQLETIQALYAWIQANMSAYLAAKDNGLAVGTAYVPRDMRTTVHKGEGVVPATFMDAIRAGELTLSGKSGTNTTIYENNYFNIEGSVVTENQLIDTLAQKTSLRKARGYI